MKLVIDRSRWLRNVTQTDELSYLIRPSDNKMCCLGFYGCALGLNPNMMRGYVSPASQPLLVWPDWLVEPFNENSEDATQLMKINDTLADEQQIIEIFARHGVEVTFTDGEEAGQ